MSLKPFAARAVDPHRSAPAIQKTLRRGFAAAQGARDVVVVAAAAGVIAFLVNDSGASAAGLAFGLGLALALWASLRAMVDWSA